MKAETLKQIVEKQHVAFRQHLINNGADPDRMKSFVVLTATKEKTLQLIDKCSTDEVMLQRIPQKLLKI